MSAAEWIGVHSASDAERRFQPGSRQASYNAVLASRELRRLYTGRVKPEPGSREIQFKDCLARPDSGTGEYLNGALLAAGS